MGSNLPNDPRGPKDTCINTKSISWDHRNSDQDGVYNNIGHIIGYNWEVKVDPSTPPPPQKKKKRKEKRKSNNNKTENNQGMTKRDKQRHFLCCSANYMLNLLSVAMSLNQSVVIILVMA